MSHWDTLREPALLGDAVEMPPAVSGDDFAGQLDDATIDYVLAAQKSFRKLRQAISQMAGVLVLEAASTSAGRIEIVRNGLELASASLAEVKDLLAAARPTVRSLHHHYHLKRAIAEVERAMAAVKPADRVAIPGATSVDILPLLKTAWTELSAAGRALPGFEVVDFSQACCAFHHNNKR